MAEAKTEKGGKPAKADKAVAKGGKADAPEAKVAKGKGRPSQSEVASVGQPKAPPKDYAARLKTLYEAVIVPKLVAEFGYKNALEVPRIDKIVLNMGVGEAVNDTKKVASAAADLALIAGQKPVVTRAKKSIATFKLRENMPIGCKVTLRRQRMYEFLDRLINVALPRVRDFRGISGKSFDGRGNFALGLKEQIVFPEIDYDRVDAVRGMNVVVTTTARTDAEAKALLKGFDMPFAN